MTMQPTITYTGDYQADRDELSRAMSRLARQFGLVAIGREYPRHITRANGYRFVRPGKWYAEMADGSRRPPSAKERAAMRKISMAPLSAYGSERFLAA